MSASRPTQYLAWNPSTSGGAQPTDSLRARGWQAGESPLASNMNFLLTLSDQWIQFLDGSVSAAVMSTTLDSSTRLIGGGTLTYVAATGVFAWSAPLNLSIAGVPDADNAIAAGNVVVQAGQVAYVQANFPFTTAADTTSGSATLANVLYANGIAAGQSIAGAGIASGATVVSVSGSTVTMSAAATASAQQTSITFAGTGALTVKSASVASLTPNANTVLIGRATSAGLFVGVNAGVILLRDGEQRRLLEAGYHDVRYLVAGQALTARQLVFIATATGGLTQGAVYPADSSAANGAQRSLAVGFVTTATASGATVPVMTGGVLGGFSGLTQGVVYYADPQTPGGITATKPSGVNYAVAVGLALDASNLYVRVSGSLNTPNLDPGFNSLLIQPIAGDTTTTQLALKNSGGTNQLTVDSGGNITTVGTAGVASLTASGAVTAASLISQAGIKTTLAPAYLNFAVTANSTPGANGNSPVALAEAGLGQVYNTKSPFKGSIVGISIIYRYTATQGTTPNLTFTLTVSGNNNSSWGTVCSAGTAGNTDYAFSNSQAKGVQPFAINDNIQGSFFSATSFSAACNFVARVTIWVEVLS